jgi:hypothetical protein
MLGFDPATGGRAYRERIGIVPQSAGFEEEFHPTRTRAPSPSDYYAASA